MIIRNISSKIVNIGSKMILPEAEISITEEEGKIPAIGAMKRVGLISIIETPHEAPKKVKEPVVEAVEEVVATEETAEDVEKSIKRVTKKKKAE